MSSTIARVRGVTFLVFYPKRFLVLLAGIFAAAVYIWVAAVRAVPGVRRRKAEVREAWRNRARRPNAA